MRHYLSLVFVLFFTGLSSASYALDAAPQHSVSPDLNGLKISYFVKKDQLKITLYAINHETSDVLCDVQYISGPDKQGAQEKTIKPEKAIDFKFHYGRNGKKVLLQLLCIDPSSLNTKTKNKPDAQDE